jgi:hypothetical protein
MCQDQCKEAINFPTPKNKIEIQKLLGTCGFYRKFINNYAKITEPLSRMLKGKTKFFGARSRPKLFQN